MIVYSAEYVLPISSDPVHRGALCIDDDRIVDVGTASDLLGRYPDAAHQDLGLSAIIPGLVNCHSHLEITAMRGLLDRVEDDFPAWLLKLNSAREKMSEADLVTAATAGAIEGVRAGVTSFGDIGRFGFAGLQALDRTGLRGVVFQETEFSPDDRTANDDAAKLRAKFETLKDRTTGLVEIGLSPHSPYTVSPKLFELIADLATGENIKVSIHAAESPEEKTLIENGKGFFMGLYKKFGLEWQSPRCSSIEFLERTGILKARPLLAHCVTVSNDDISLITASGSSVAHCPRSNAKFGHGAAPLERLIENGVTVGLGSDSVASNNACDLLEESAFAALTARNRPDHTRSISAGEVLRAATIGGARALGLGDKVGTLEAGKQADVAVISLDNIAQQPINDIYAALVFSSNARDVSMTMVAGRELYRDGKLSTVDEHAIRSELNAIAAKFDGD